MRSLRAAIVGAGVMGANHARVMRSLQGVTLEAVVDPLGDPKGIGGSALTLDSIEKLATHDIDFAVVATPPLQHEQNVIQLAQMGIHVLVEKPISFSGHSGRGIKTALRQAGLLGAVGHIERFNPAILELKKSLAENRIGEIFQVATRRQGSFPERIGDVGVVMDLATHDFDFTSWLGNSNYGKIFASVRTSGIGPHEDLVSVTGSLENGIVVSHIVNWLSPIKERTVVVTGSEGTLIADTLTSDLTIYEKANTRIEWESVANFRGPSEGLVSRLIVNKREPLRLELEGFRDLVSSGQGPHVTIDEGIRAVEVAEAALVSGKTGLPVECSTPLEKPRTKV